MIIQSKMAKTLLILCATIALTAAATLPGRIIGGSDAKDGQFPHQVSLRFMGYHFCGGSIIGPRHILTAGHCTVGVNATDVVVVAGTNSLSQGGDKYDVESSHSHEKFDFDNITDDIAFIKLKRDIKFEKGRVEMIELNTSPIGGGEEVVLSGWGSISFPQEELPDRLQYAVLKSVTNEDCADKLSIFPYPILDTNVCSLTKEGQGACHGDSGGPLVFGSKLAGVVSWGNPCALGYPDVFTRVSEYIDWIKSQMN